jgi:hypothetical protein
VLGPHQRQHELRRRLIEAQIEEGEQDERYGHEALLGAVSDDGDIEWSGDPRSMFKPKSR